MKNLLRILVSLAFLLPLSLQAEEKEYLLVNESVNLEAVDKSDLAKIFLGKTVNWPGGGRIVLGYSTENGEELENFFQEVMGKSRKRFHKYWLKKVFSGYGVAPKQFRSDKEAMEFVRDRAGAVVYVSLNQPVAQEGVKLLTVR